jgi:hypothetical protein
LTGVTPQVNHKLKMTLTGKFKKPDDFKNVTPPAF